MYVFCATVPIFFAAPLELGRLRFSEDCLILEELMHFEGEMDRDLAGTPPGGGGAWQDFCRVEMVTSDVEAL